MKKLLLGLLLSLLASAAIAQTCPTRPTADSSNACASTAFVHNVANTPFVLAFPVTVSGTVTSGGIPYFSSTTSMASSGVLATGAIVVGGGAGGAPTTSTLTALIDAQLGSTQGSVIYRNASAWVVLTPGSAGNILTSGGPAANVSWSAAGTGTVTSVATQANIVGGTITTTGTLSQQQMNPGGRLTLQSATPVMVSNSSAATVIYYAPYIHPWIPTYDGSNMILRQFTSSATDAVGLSVTLGNNWAASTLYDWFVGLDSSTLRLCSGPAWSSSTAGSSSRGTGAGTTELELYNGVWVNKNSMTCRYANASTFTCAVRQCTYTGTGINGSGTGTINWILGASSNGGTAANLGLWNAYNRVSVTTQVGDNSASWNYSTANTWRSADNSTGNRCTMVTGLATDGVDVDYGVTATGTAGTVSAGAGIGVNVTNSPSGLFSLTNTGQAFIQGRYANFVAIGLNFFQAIEEATAASTVTFNNGGQAVTTCRFRM